MMMIPKISFIFAVIVVDRSAAAPSSKLTAHDVRSENSTVLNFAKRRYDGIEENAFASSDAAKSLDLSNNMIEHVSSDVFAGLKNLDSLNLKKNRLRSLPVGIFSKLKQLKTLYLSDNEISLLDAKVFDKLKNLDNLNIRGNKITNIPDGCFSNLHRLRRLTISDNPITDLDANVFQGLKKLHDLTVSKTNLTELPAKIFANLVALTELYFSKNSITVVKNEQFRNLNNLLILDISDNAIIEIPKSSFANLKRLKFLNMAGNCIKFFDPNVFRKLENLTILDFSRNSIEILDPEIFSNLANLNKLSMRNNSITLLPELLFHNLEKLWHLDLSENSITDITKETFSGLERLEKLFVSTNPIEIIDENLFNDLKSLNNLHFAKTRITEFPKRLFAKNRQLSRLDLSDNVENTNLPSFHGLNRLTYLDISGNRRLKMLTSNTLVGLEQDCRVTLGTRDEEIAISTAVYGDPVGEIVEFDGKMANDDDEKPIAHGGLTRTHRLVACVRSNKLTSLKVLGLKEKPEAADCHEINPTPAGVIIYGLGIAEFKPKWHKVPKKVGITGGWSSMSFIMNNIINLSEHMLNGLPKYITAFRINHNGIERVESNVLDHETIEQLDFASNNITTIDDYAFAKIPKLKILILSSNKICGIEFLKTLPRNIEKLYLTNNLIEDIGPMTLVNLTSLLYLDICENNVKTIDEANFGSLPNLIRLDLAGNDIRSIGKGAFVGLDNLKHLTLTSNGIAIVHKNMFYPSVKSVRDPANNDIVLPGVLENLCTLQFDRSSITKLDSDILIRMRKSENPDISCHVRLFGIASVSRINK